MFIFLVTNSPVRTKQLKGNLPENLLASYCSSREFRLLSLALFLRVSSCFPLYSSVKTEKKDMQYKTICLVGQIIFENGTNTACIYTYLIHLSISVAVAQQSSCFVLVTYFARLPVFVVSVVPFLPPFCSHSFLFAAEVLLSVPPPFCSLSFLFAAEVLLDIPPPFCSLWILFAAEVLLDVLPPFCSL